MAIPRPGEVGRSFHLQPCPGCGADNGITALACWQCDLRLRPDPPPRLSLWPERDSAARAELAAVPVLNEAVAVPDRAANDSVLESGPASVPAPDGLPGPPGAEAPGRWRHLVLGGTAVAVVLMLAVPLGPHERADTPPSWAVQALPAPEPARLVLHKPAVPDRSDGDVVLAVAPVAAPVAKPPPVQAPCTPQVAALGLCQPASQ